MPHIEYTIFAYALTTSSFIKDIIESSSRKINANLNEILTSFDKHSSHSFSISYDKSFATASREPYSSDRYSVSNMQILNIHVKSLPFDYSKYSSRLRSSCQEIIASIKDEKRLELAKEPLFFEEKPSSAHLPFKKIFVLEFEDRDSVSHVDKTLTKVF